MKGLAKDQSLMASHFYRFIEIQDHFGVNVTIWKMIITQPDLKCQLLKESVVQTKINNGMKNIMLLTLELLIAVAKIFDFNGGNFLLLDDETFCSHAVYCN